MTDPVLTTCVSSIGLTDSRTIPPAAPASHAPRTARPSGRPMRIRWRLALAYSERRHGK
jgi:hypothetical protein